MKKLFLKAPGKADKDESVSPSSSPRLKSPRSPRSRSASSVDGFAVCGVFSVRLQSAPPFPVRMRHARFATMLSAEGPAVCWQLDEDSKLVSKNRREKREEEEKKMRNKSHFFFFF